MRPREEENEERTLLMQEESRHQPRGKELLPLGAQIPLLLTTTHKHVESPRSHPTVMMVHNSRRKCLLRFHSMMYTTERVLPANAVWFWQQPFANFPYKHAGSPLFPGLKYAVAVPLLWFMETFVRQRPSETRCFDLRHRLVIFFLFFRNLTSGRLGGPLGKWLKVALCSGVEM